MHSLRVFFRHHRRLAILLIALTLCIRALVPAGYMIGTEARMLSIGVCAESTGQQITRQIAVPMRDHAGKHATVDHTCPYGSLAHAALGGADPIQLAAAIAFVLTLGLAPVAAPALGRRPYLQPPLRGPPALA